MFMMAPALRLANALAAAAASTVGAVMLSAISFSSTSEPFSSRPPFSDTPALLTSVVIVASPARRPSTCARSARFVRSAGSTSMPRPVDARSLSAIACILAASLATRMRSCPRWASLSAYTAPMPDDAPVTRAAPRLLAIFSISLRPAGCEVACKKLVTSLSLCNGHREIFHWRLPDSPRTGDRRRCMEHVDPARRGSRHDALRSIQGESRHCAQHSGAALEEAHASRAADQNEV